MTLDRCAPPKPVKRTAAERALARQLRRQERLSATHGRAVAEATNASNSPDLALSKGLSRDAETAEASRAERRQIQNTYRKVMARTIYCEVCGDSERETAEKSAIAKHQMHEDPSRAQTRGLPPAQRFNVYICGRVCDPCHVQLTNHVLAVHFHDEVRRWLGDYDIVDQLTGHIVRHMRRAVDSRLQLNPSSLQERAS